MKVTSPAFSDGATIPEKYTGDGPDVSPPLSIKDVDPKAVSLVIIMDDPDAPAGTFTHWVIWNIPTKITEIPEKVPRDREVKSLGGAKHGMTDFGELGYGGPSPPPGKPHRYMFNVFALGTKLDLLAGTSRDALERAMKGHVLAKAVLTGIYER